MPANSDAPKIVEELRRLRDAPISDPERQRQLTLIQRRVMLSLKGWRKRPDWIPVPDSKDDELPAWERLARALESRFPHRIDRVDLVSDYQVPLLGQGRSLHMAPVERAGAWVNHAIQLVELLAELMEPATRHSGKEKAARPLVAFPTPAGATWDDVRFVVTDTSLRIDVDGIHKEYTFQEAGFEERRKGAVPDLLWMLLKTFATHGGFLPNEAVDKKTRTNLKKYVSELRKRLLALLPGVDGDPIPYDRTEHSYRTAFRVDSTEIPLFPTPAGASWQDVCISKRGEGSVCIAVTTRERFPTSRYGGDEEKGRDVQWDVGEREGAVEREYDLRTLQLADERGKPSRAGEALLATLAGNGVVKCKADDEGMLKLGSVLSKLMDIDGAPFEFATLEEKWIAHFDASDEPDSDR